MPGEMGKKAIMKLSGVCCLHGASQESKKFGNCWTCCLTEEEKVKSAVKTVDSGVCWRVCFPAEPQCPENSVSTSCSLNSKEIVDMLSCRKRNNLETAGPAASRMPLMVWPNLLWIAKSRPPWRLRVTVQIVINQSIPRRAKTAK